MTWVYYENWIRLLGVTLLKYFRDYWILLNGENPSKRHVFQSSGGGVIKGPNMGLANQNYGT